MGSVPFAHGLSEHPDPLAAAEEASAQVAAALDGAPDVAFLFFTAAHLDGAEAIAAAVRQRLTPGVLAGSSALSVVGGSREVEEGPAVSLLAGMTGGARSGRWWAVRSGQGLVVHTPSDEELEAAHTLLLLADPFTFPLDGYLERLAADHPSLTVVGGLASASAQPRGNRLVLDGEVHDHGAVGVLLDGPVRVSAVVSQGCHPVGAPAVVTGADGNRIFELAGQPAVAYLADLLRSLPEGERARAMQGLQIGRVIDEHQESFQRGDFLIRSLLGIDQESQALVVGDVVPVGATVQFQLRDAEAADTDLREALQGRHADAALLFTCNGRGSRLFGLPDHDARTVGELLGSPVTAGMFCAGEVGPVGARPFLHGFTASLALFQEPG